MNIVDRCGDTTEGVGVIEGVEGTGIMEAPGVTPKLLGPR